MAGLTDAGGRPDDGGRPNGGDGSHAGEIRGPGRRRDDDAGARSGERPGPRGDARGQLLVTGVVVMSVLLVTLAVLLNSAIFTGNLGAREGATDDGRVAAQYQAAATAMTERAIRHANRYHNASDATLYRNLSRTVARWSDLSGRQAAVTGGSLNVSLRGTTNGSRVRQTNFTREFTDTTGDANWTVVSDATIVRGIRLQVDDDELNASGDREFRFVVRNGSARWVLNVSVDASGTSVVGVVGAGGGAVDTCTTAEDTFWVNASEGTVAGASCPALNGSARPTGTVEVLYRNATAVTGRYSLVTDGDVSNDLETTPSDEDPYATERIVAAEIGVAYVTPELAYRTAVTVEPEGSDD